VASGEQKTIQAISGGISTIYTIALWVQRFISVVAVVIALLVTAIWWLMSILDLASGKASLNGGGLLLVLGLILVSYIVIIYFMLLKKPRANPNEP
jgi:phage shock protein PspC (stress-responsive transcriptional regulator)